MSVRIVETTLTEAVNEPLLREVLDLVEAETMSGEGRWDQDRWRSVPEDRCGTSMCFAGWAGLRAGLRYVIPESRARAAIDADVDQAALSFVIVSRAEAAEIRRTCGDVSLVPLEQWYLVEGVRRFDASLLTDLPEEPWVAHISSAAAWKLGIGSDPLGLFRATNMLWQLRSIVGSYIRLSPEVEVEVAPEVEVGTEVSE